jgi:ABC-type transport system substrate-binding protein
MQEQLRRVGVAVEIRALEFRTYVAAAQSGDWDLNLDQRFQDPSPLGLANTWGCNGSPLSNLARYCNPAVDTLLRAARTASGDPGRRWREILATLAADHPAVFLYARENVFPLPRHLTRTELRPESLWRMAWAWSGDGAPAR